MIVSMNIVIPKTKSVSNKLIIELEKEFGSLPKDYLSFLKEHDGAKPESNVFKLSKNNTSSVEKFILSDNIIQRRDSVQGFPSNMLPIADDACGNIFYINPNNGNVYFWDHEIESDGIKITSSFSEFLDKLQKFNIDEIKFKHGQVKSVWIDPDFKSKL